MASVRFEHINKYFGKVEVVHDINLTVNDHELVVMVGPSGSGKSTILRMVAGLDEPSGGHVSLQTARASLRGWSEPGQRSRDSSGGAAPLS